MITLPGVDFNRELDRLRIEDAQASVGDAAHAIAAGLGSFVRRMRADRSAGIRIAAKATLGAIAMAVVVRMPLSSMRLHFSATIKR
jgi:hypothetical protein